MVAQFQFSIQRDGGNMYDWINKEMHGTVYVRGGAALFFFFFNAHVIKKKIISNNLGQFHFKPSNFIY